MERVGIFVDGDYLYWAFPRVDVAALRNILVADRFLAFGFWFQAYADQEDLNRKQGFFRFLQGLGFTVCPVPLKTNAEGKKKSRVDAFLAAELSRRLLAEELGNAPRTDTFVLVSGDSDYEPILRLAKERNRRIEVAHKQGLSMELRALADRTIDLHVYEEELSRELSGPKTGPQEIPVEAVILKIQAAGKVLEIPIFLKGRGP